ncbi:uncharacterized protein ATC70_004654 [Mucor velutinosus]|uniref:Reverse transcriptase domain-containing protein n=1 Tax=Mucor velutinosus TaxID=708070 RepID=A0AAN7DSX2_9FUNG|nr:hypothetical protein ATC70_004654 [Mucor velutinosus]
MDTDTPATLMSQMDLQRLVLTMQQDISAHNSALQELNALKTTILNLQKQNESLTQENERLRQQLNSQQGSTTTQAQPKSAPNATKKTPNNSWTEVIKRSKKVRNPADVTDKHRQAITRGFNLAPEGPKGYTTVYFNRSRRFTRTEVRNNLHLIKADASRIIDVTFPARNIIGVLVHLQYKDNLVSILTKNNINVVEGFDPTDPKHLADPKFKEMSLSKREDAAFDLQINRCAKSLVYLANRRSRLFASVANHFLENGWTTTEYIDSVAPVNNIFGSSGFKKSSGSSDVDIHYTSSSLPDHPLSASNPSSSIPTILNNTIPTTPPPPTALAPVINSASQLTPLTIGLWNARGLRDTTIDDVLRYCQSFSVLFITETWLNRHPIRLPTNWQQFHLPGVTVAGGGRGSRGITCLINPSCPLTAFQTPLPSALQEFALGIQLGRELRLICLYIPPEQADLYTENVSSILNAIPLDHDTIICGDLNARMGSFVGDSSTNNRGRLLQEYCADNQLNVLNCQLAHSTPTFEDRRSGRNVSSIVDYYISNVESLSFASLDTSSPPSSSSISIYSDLSLGSDHKLMSLTFDYHSNEPALAMPATPSPSPRLLWKLSRLQETDVRNLYAQRFTALSQPLLQQLISLVRSPPDTQPPIDTLNSDLTNCIYQALDESVTRQSQRPNFWKKFWTLDLQRLCDHREALYRKYRRCPASLDKAYWWNQHVEAYQKFKQALRRAKQVSWHAFCESLFKQDFSKAMSKIKLIKSRRQRQSGYLHVDGAQAGANAMRDHLATIYAGSNLPTNRPPCPFATHGRHLPYGVPPPQSASHLGGTRLANGDISTLNPHASPFIPSYLSHRTLPHDDSDPTRRVVSASVHNEAFDEIISIDHIIQQIKSLPYRKAPGRDSIRGEMLKPIQKPLATVLSYLFALTYQWSYTPADWRHGNVCSIYKKGPVTEASSFRPISLTSTLRKLFEMCLAPLVLTISPPLDVAQNGFRSARSALDSALSLQDLMKDYQNQHYHWPTVCFLDIKSAYDVVDRRVIWNSLLSANAPMPLVSLLSNLFDDVSISVLNQQCVSQELSLHTGLLQGSTLSPHLFSIFINSLPALLRQAASSSTTRVMSTSPSCAPSPLWSVITPTHATNIAINALLYADDVAILGSAREVKQMLTLAESHSLALGYRWAPAKCAIINPPSSTSSTFVDLTLYGESLPVVNEFVYLGIPFDRKGICTASIVKKCQRGTMASMAQLNSIGCNRSGFPLLFSTKLYASFIRPKLEYGIGIANMRVADFKALEKVQDTCLRMIFGGHRAASTMVFRHMTNLPLMRQRAAILVTQFCLRSQFLPEDGLLILLSDSLPGSSLKRLKKQHMAARALDEVPFANQRHMKQWFLAERQHWHAEFLTKTDMVLIRACRPTIGIDPVMYVPASRPCRSRLIRYRMGWLPGKPRPCACNEDHTSRRHLHECPTLPPTLLLSLPVPPADFTGTIIDHALNLIPSSSSPSNCPPWWSDLCTLLWHFDQLCNPDGDYTTDPVPGQVWASPA